MRRRYALLAVFLFAVPSSAQEAPSESPEVELASAPVRFDTLIVDGRGAEAVITFSWTAMESGEVTFRFRATDEKHPAQSPPPVVFSRTVQEGASGTEQVPVRITPQRNHTLAVTAEGSAEGGLATRHVALRSVGSEVLLFDPWAIPEPQDDLPTRAAAGGDLPQTASAGGGPGARSDQAPQSSHGGQTLRTVRIRGRIQTQGHPRSDEYFGAYGMEVWLFFRRPGAPFVKAELVRHSGPTQQHVHYDILDEQGNFSFEFQTDDYLTPYSEVAIVPTLLSPVAWVSPGPPNSVAYYDPWTGRYEDFLPPEAGGVTIPIPSSGPIDVYGEDDVDLTYGRVFRYMELSRELAYREYNGYPPFSLPAVDVDLNSGYGGGEFNVSGIEIWLDGGNNPAVIAHEYGHYMMFDMYGRSWNRYLLRNNNLREGWALFFSFAARAFAAGAYSDVSLASQNVELGAYPFYTSSTTRYEGLYGVHYDIAGIGALLWSLYDARPATLYEYASSPWDNDNLLGDNDDISGYRHDVWESVRTTGASIFDEAGIAEVTATFRSRVPAVLSPSVDDAYDFFLCPGFPDGCSVSSLRNMPSRRPRPVQASGLQGQYVSSSTVDLTWSRNTYDLGFGFANAPTGYRVYRDGAVIATLSATASSYRHTGGAVGTYRVVAFNAEGEAYAPPLVIVYEPLEAGISGLSELGWKQSGTWTASYDGGSGAAAYRWYYRSAGASSWLDTGVTAASYSRTMTTFDFELRVGVSRGGETAYAEHAVAYCASTPCILEFAGARAGLAYETALVGAVPNPARGAAVVRFTLEQASAIRLTVYDALGREMTRLVNETREAGAHEVRMDAAALPPGVYVVRMEAGSYAATRRVTVVR